MIDKNYAPPMGMPQDEDEPLEVEMAAEPGLQDDGSMVIDLGPEEKTLPNTGHDENLAESMNPNDLKKLAGDLIEDVEDDMRSRSDWEKTYKDGLRLLGLKIEERSEPWDGACGIIHPLLAEAVVRFQAELSTETFPPAGPVKTKVWGKETKEKLEAANRVRDDMNIEITDRMTEYRGEHERLLWNLPIAGSALKKIYFDPTLGRQVSMFVAAEDFVVAYGASDLASCPRYTHVLKKTKNEVRKLQDAGFYREVELGDPTEHLSEIGAEKDKIAGVSGSIEVNHHTIYEINADLVLPGEGDEDAIACPYIVSIDKDSEEVLAIRRNWKEDDEKKQKKLYFVHYTYIPGFGFYGFGLIHLVGSYADGATSILRQLVDAGTLSNLPGGLKTRGLRIKGDDTPIGPGEWRDVDVPGGTLKENLLPLPYKEPSMVLADLLGRIIEDGRKFAAIAEMKVEDFDSNSPVGTTMALLERTLKVMSSVQARIYEAMKHEFRLIKELIRDFGESEYEYEPDTGSRYSRRQDYKTVDVLPVADPNAATMSQRIVQWQAVMQLAAQAPQIYDMPELHGQMLDILGVKNTDKLIPGRKDTMKPTDPVTENMKLITMQPVKAFITQDHQSHITAHQAMMQDPLMQQMIGQNPQGQQIAAAAMAHLMEHTAFLYRQQIEQHLGTTLPHPDSPMDPEIEAQVSGLLARAGEKLLLQHQSEAQQMQAQQQAQDPVLQQQMAETQIKQQEVQRKIAKDQADIQIAQQKLELEKVKVMADAEAAGVEVDAEMQRNAMEMDFKRQEHEMNMRHEQEKLALETQRDQFKHSQQMQMEREKAVNQSQTESIRANTQMQHEDQRHQMNMHHQAQQGELKNIDSQRKIGEAGEMAKIKQTAAKTAAKKPAAKKAAKPGDKK